MEKFDDKHIHTFYICEEYAELEDNIFSIIDLQAVIICSKITLFKYLNIKPDQTVEELGFAWVNIDYYKNKGFSVHIFNKDGSITKV